MTTRARWDPGWYNLDQPLKVGLRDTFTFSHSAPQDHDVQFLSDMLRTGDYYYGTAMVESIEHAHLGTVVQVDTQAFGQYTLTFADGQWATIEAEEGVGHVNAASRGFPVGECDPAWAQNSGWMLTVVLSDFVRTTRRD